MSCVVYALHVDLEVMQARKYERDRAAANRNLCSCSPGRKSAGARKFTQRATSRRGAMESMAGKHVVVTGGGRGIG